MRKHFSSRCINRTRETSGFWPLLCSAILALGLTSSAFAQAGPWKQVEPKPTGDNISKIVYGNGTFVGVSRNGEVLLSQDGIEWEKASAPGSAVPQITNVAFGNDTFVGLGKNLAIQGIDTKSEPDALPSAIYTSRDGREWKRRRVRNSDGSLIFSEFSQIIFGGDTFVAIGQTVAGSYGETAIVVSKDGINWHRSSFNQSFYFQDITFGAGKFVGVPAFGSERLVSSDGGISWKKSALVLPGTDHPGVNSISYGRNVFVISGESHSKPFIATSEDSLNWTVRPLPGRFRMGSILYCNDRFLGCDEESPTLLSSIDGIHWTKSEFKLESADPINVRFGYGNNLYVASGAGGVIATSLDGIDFTQRTPLGNALPLSDVAFGNGMFVAVGGVVSEKVRLHNVIETSVDGKKWVVRDGGLPAAARLISVTYGDGRFVAVGLADEVTKNGICAISSDGVQWATNPIGNGRSILTDPQDIAYGAGRFVVVGDGKSYSSSDCITWEKSSLEEHNLGNTMNIAWNGERFLVTVSGSRFVSSTNGTDWTSIETRSNPPFLQSLWRANILTASPSGTFGLASKDLFLVSKNGEDWRGFDTDFDSSGWNAVAIGYGNGAFLAMTPYMDYMLSTRGKDLARSAAYNGAFSALASGNRMFVSVGPGANISTSKFRKPPFILGPTHLSGSTNQTFFHQIKTFGPATRFRSARLPHGLKLDPKTGVISGTPDQPGIFPVYIQAEHMGADSGEQLVIEIASNS